MSTLSKGIYFPGLNGLRFIAAFLVIISHVEEMKMLFGYENWRLVPTIEHIGAISVTFFFVLSGFLITYLLLEEKKQTRWICLTSFYSKRITRIWPLYYLIVILGIFIIPHISALHIPGNPFPFIPKIIALFLLIFPNLVFGFYGFTPYTVQTWSIGVEEQFYMIWPLLFRFTSNYLRNMIGIIVGYMAVFVLLKAGILITKSMHYLPLAETEFLEHILTFLSFTRIDCMAIGGIGAWAVFYRRKRILSLVYHPLIIGISTFVLVALMLKGTILPVVGHRLYAGLFIIVILNIATNPGRLTYLLENRTLNYLGKISYGIYMYHFLVIGVVIALLRNNLLTHPMNWLSHTILYALVVGLTIGVSAVSYHAFEYPFIRNRAKWLAAFRRITKIHNLRPYLKQHLLHKA